MRRVDVAPGGEPLWVLFEDFVIFFRREEG